jgi:hypothetical protein
MRRAWIAAMAVALVAVPPAAAAHGGDRPDSGKKNRSHACKALRAQMGAELFRETYGTNRNKRNAHGKCVSEHRRPFRKLVAQAVRECKAQLEAKQSRFFKGDDRRDDRRAFRQCVKDRLRALLAERRAALEAAAKSCDAERTADAAAFREKYGRGEHKRHAFFRCVVQTFRASQAQGA